MIIADQRLPAVRIWSDDPYCFQFFFIKRKNPVIFQQNKAFFRCFLRCIQMPGRFYLQIGDIVIFASIKQPQQKPCGKKPHCCPGYGFFCDKPLFVCLHNVKISISTIQITAIINRQSCRFNGCIRYHMVFVKITDRPAV